jgi:hypothetical protein
MEGDPHWFLRATLLTDLPRCRPTMLCNSPRNLCLYWALELKKFNAEIKILSVSCTFSSGACGGGK